MHRPTTAQGSFEQLSFARVVPDRAQRRLQLCTRYQIEFALVDHFLAYRKSVRGQGQTARLFLAVKVAEDLFDRHERPWPVQPSEQSTVEGWVSLDEARFGIGQACRHGRAIEQDSACRMLVSSTLDGVISSSIAIGLRGCRGALALRSVGYGCGQHWETSVISPELGRRGIPRRCV